MSVNKEITMTQIKKCSRCKRDLPWGSFRTNDYGVPLCHCRQCERETQRIRDQKKRLLKLNKPEDKTMNKNNTDKVEADE